MDSTGRSRETKRFCEHCGKEISLSAWYRHRDNPVIEPYPRKPKACSIDGCDRPAERKGWCLAHYKRFRYGGDPHGKYRMRGEGALNHGYHVHTKDKRRKLEHRRVMEEVLGRALLPEEIVHHKDGNPLNNDPSNLQVITRHEHRAIHRDMRKTCKRGHPWTPESSYWKPATKTSGPQRECRICQKEVRRRYYETHGK